jgi:Na+-driven multidrug efflux pump
MTTSILIIYFLCHILLIISVHALLAKSIIKNSEKGIARFFQRVLIISYFIVTPLAFYGRFFFLTDYFKRLK